MLCSRGKILNFLMSEIYDFPDFEPGYLPSTSSSIFNIPKLDFRQINHSLVQGDTANFSCRPFRFGDS